ncbi:hypothetical protein NDA03_24840 [Trichocoleus sp. Lan]|uniref:hypothetical protein n=1 Tax=Trichocoleus sp. Lan TaxID=2933927 RepID=UPI00329A3630
MDSLFAYLLYLATLSPVVWGSLNSKNYFLLIFGFVYSIYSLGFIIKDFKFQYFYEIFHINFNADNYILLIIINLSMLAIIILDRVYFKNTIKSNYSIKINKLRILSYIFISLGSLALLNELAFYGLKDFILLNKATRFAEILKKTPNLYFISINYHLFLLSGFYGVASTSKKKFSRYIIYALMLIVGIVGLLQGFRYYVGILFMLFILNYQARNKLPVVKVVVLTIIGLVLSELSRVVAGYIFFYNWVGKYGFINYFLRVFETYNIFIPKEIAAITTNTYIGLSNLDKLKPDLLGYIIKLFPLSERFYDFKNFEHFYAQIATISGLRLETGQGTAFSFFLENHTSYFFPMFFAALVSYLWRIHQSPILLVILINLALNLVRNGLIISIGELKTPLLIYFLFYFAIQLIFVKNSRKYPLDINPYG